MAIDQCAVVGIEITDNHGAIDFADLAMDPANPTVIKIDISVGVSTENRWQLIETDRNRWHNRGEVGKYDFHV